MDNQTFNATKLFKDFHKNLNKQETRKEEFIRLCKVIEASYALGFYHSTIYYPKNVDKLRTLGFIVFRDNKRKDFAWTIDWRYPYSQLRAVDAIKPGETFFRRHSIFKIDNENSFHKYRAIRHEQGFLGMLLIAKDLKERRNVIFDYNYSYQYYVINEKAAKKAIQRVW